VPHFTAVDWLILLLYFGLVLIVGHSLKTRIQTASDFLQAGRKLPAWVGGLAFAVAGMGALEVIVMGGAGARYGMEAAHFFWIGAIPAMIFAGLFMMPSYYGSRARSTPEFLGARFDPKTRLLSAGLIALTTILLSGISLYAMGRILETLHLFDVPLHALGWGSHAIFMVAILLPAAAVLLYVLWGGLAGAAYNQVVQFFLLVGGLLPLVFFGLRKIGGWSGLAAAVDPQLLHPWRGVLHSGGNPMGLEIAGLAMGLGVVLSASHWCADFRVLQTAMAAKNMDAARRIPLLAAIPWMLFPFLVVLPGLIAIGLPTPRTTTEIRYENGAIYHTINVVAPAAEAGQGLVPARTDAKTGQIAMDASGRPLLDYDLAIPNLLANVLPAGLLGLGITALLAGLMSGLAANLTAFNSVLTCDIYQAHIRRDASDGHYLKTGRWATLGGVVLSLGAACAALHFGNLLDALQLVFSLVNAPLLATFLLGIFWKRATGHGAFAGLLAGMGTALLHHGLTLPEGAQAGLHGGWIAVRHRYPSDLAMNLWTAIFAFTVCLLVTVAVSLLTRAKPERELVGLVYSLSPRAKTKLAWWKRPEALAAVVLLALVAVCVFFA
jgi:SSS family solute:Na+ symporter